MANIAEIISNGTHEVIVDALNAKYEIDPPVQTIQEAVEIINNSEQSPSEPETDPVVKYTVSYNANGGTGSIESVEVFAGESMNVSDGTGLTAPEGKEFAGWAKTDSAQSATVTSPFTPSKDTVLYAVWTDAAQE